RVRVPDDGDEPAPQSGHRDGVPDGRSAPPGDRLAPGQGDRPVGRRDRQFRQPRGGGRCPRKGSKTRMKSRSTALGLTLLAGIAALAAAPSVQAQAARAPNPPSAAEVPVAASDWRTVAPENLWVIDTTKGRILVELSPRA